MDNQNREGESSQREGGGGAYDQWSLQCQLSSATWCCYVCVVTVHVQMFRNYKFVMLNMIVFARVLPPRSGWLQIQSSAHCEVLHHSQWEDR